MTSCKLIHALLLHSKGAGDPLPAGCCQRNLSALWRSTRERPPIHIASTIAGHTHYPAIAMSDRALTYRLACLCDLRDEQGRILLLRRRKAPNLGLCSPIGGKLDMARGESPAQCAIREIKEEAGIDVSPPRLHLLGLISERSYEDSGHWLLFYYRVRGAVSVPPGPIREGDLEWHSPGAIAHLPLPDTDRRIIWPLVERHESTAGVPGFFAVHIECEGGKLSWTVDQSIAPK